MKKEFLKAATEARKLMSEVVAEAKKIILAQFTFSVERGLEEVEVEIEKALAKEEIWINNREYITHLTWDDDNAECTVWTKDDWNDEFEYGLDDLEGETIIDLALMFYKQQQ